MSENHSNEFPNGYTRVPHEILNAIATSNFTAQEHRIINLIIRTTYGCGKDYLTLNNWAELSVAGIYRPDCRHNIERLQTAKIIIIDWIHKSIKLNPNCSQWLSQNELANSNSETYKKIISRQLFVGESLTMKKQKLANHEQQSKRNANNAISESLTSTEPTSNNSFPESTPKDSIKDNIKNNNTHPTSNVITNSNPLDKLFGNGVSGFHNLLDSEQKDEARHKQALLACQDVGILSRGFFNLPLQYIIDSIVDAKEHAITDAGTIVNLIQANSRLEKWISSRLEEYKNNGNGILH